MPEPQNRDITQGRPRQRKSANKVHSLAKRRLLKSIDSAYTQNKEPLPGLLRTSKVPSGVNRMTTSGSSPAFVGFNASNLVFDGNRNSKTVDDHQFLSQFMADNQPPPPQLSVVNVNNQVNPSHSGSDVISVVSQASVMSRSQRQSSLLSHSLVELRNYSALMDQYSLHNFLIWNGKSLRNTPEFLSFRRTFDHDWGPISTVISALEQMMSTYSVKLAIVNGQRTAEYALCGQAYFQESDLLNCISNLEQIKPMITSCVRDGGPVDKPRAVVKIQSAARQWLARRKYQRLKKNINSAIKLQSVARMFIFRCRAVALIGHARITADHVWEHNATNLKNMWSDCRPGRARLYIHIPSIRATETERLTMENMAAVENSHIGCLHQLEDPDVHIAYICPCYFGVPETNFHDKFLQALGVSTLPKRLRFIVPDMLRRVQSHMPLAEVLWYCSATLRKLRALVKQFSSAIIICNAVGWAEKRISNFLRVPLFSPDTTVADTLTGPSFSKQAFLDAQVNIPLGAHDISVEEDFMLTLARLIASNIEVNRWIFKLNSDDHNDTLAYLDVQNIAMVRTIRGEQVQLVQRHRGDVQPWFSKHVQASARKRVLQALESELSNVVKISRQDVIPNWSVYVVYLQRYGSVIEAEPPAIIGYVEGLCLIDPIGVVQGVRGVDSILDDNYQTVSYAYPQTGTPQPSLEGATAAVGNILYQKWKVCGFVQVSFVSYWDTYDGLPKLWALRLRFGMTSAFDGIGTFSVALRNTQKIQPLDPDDDGRDKSSPSPMIRSLLPLIPEGRCCVHLPSVVHLPLRSGRDDVFFRQCRMNGIAYDPKSNLGTLFFLVDSIVGGVLSILCIGSTRKKTLEMMVDVLAFISSNFGKEKIDGESVRSWNDLGLILARLRQTLRREEARDKKQLQVKKTNGYANTIGKTKTFPSSTLPTTNS
eukprot:CAMPEP_0182434300 /NCGR_PEP_ID=MMETSP1167-20130531/68962_1 /TAXON_ID=2988 /ORGANISM="Mallomonas Sp, Strain CCMP3275" /LENGTH=934 /DNA_ID=CAMNT_0024624007 /DNA_START=118 /DNA_END=2922 /DNA_ORIENTATION=-